MKEPVSPWFSCMLTAAIGISFATDCIGRMFFALAFGVSLVIVMLRIAHNWSES